MQNILFVLKNGSRYIGIPVVVLFLNNGQEYAHRKLNLSLPFISCLVSFGITQVQNCCCKTTTLKLKLFCFSKPYSRHGLYWNGLACLSYESRKWELFYRTMKAKRTNRCRHRQDNGGKRTGCRDIFTSRCRITVHASERPARISAPIGQSERGTPENRASQSVDLHPNQLSEVFSNEWNRQIPDKTWSFLKPTCGYYIVHWNSNFWILIMS